MFINTTELLYELFLVTSLSLVIFILCVGWGGWEENELSVAVSYYGK